MAMMTCAECGKNVSDRAESCPGCGAPIGGVQTIEKTGKGIKFILLISFLATITGCAGMFAKMPGSDVKGAEYARQIDAALPYTFSFVLGLIVFVSAKFAQWWRHG